MEVLNNHPPSLKAPSSLKCHKTQCKQLCNSNQGCPGHPERLLGYYLGREVYPPSLKTNGVVSQQRKWTDLHRTKVPSSQPALPRSPDLLGIHRRTWQGTAFLNTTVGLDVDSRANAPKLSPCAALSVLCRAVRMGHSVLGETAVWPRPGHWADSKTREHSHPKLCFQPRCENGGCPLPCFGVVVPGFAISQSLG